MKLISHRGNVFGKNEKWENSPMYLDGAISLGYDVEVDVWANPAYERNSKDITLHLGHDRADFRVYEDYIRKIGPHAWFHCKNLEAFQFFSRWESGYRYFMHDTDSYVPVLFSGGYLDALSLFAVWCFPGQFIPSNGVSVMPEIVHSKEYSFEQHVLDMREKHIVGICSDFVGDIAQIK